MALARLTPVLFVVWVLGVLASFLGVLQSVRRIPVGFLLLLPVMVFVEVLVLTAMVSVGRRALRLVCPSCDKVMVSYDQPAGRLTLARGRCSGCGRLLVGETASGRPERVPPPTTPLGLSNAATVWRPPAAGITSSQSLWQRLGSWRAGSAQQLS